MQYIKYAGIAIALFMSGSIMAQQTEAKADTSKPVPSASAKSEIKVPSDEEIKGFVTEYKESATSTTTVTFRAHFAVPRLKPEQKQKYIDAKTSPIQVTMDLVKYQTVENKTKYVGRIMQGTGSFVILDEEGKVVKSMSDNLIKLCSSWGGSGGYLGEVAKSGKYKAIVWVKMPNGVTLGKVMDLSVTIP